MSHFKLIISLYACCILMSLKCREEICPEETQYHVKVSIENEDTLSDRYDIYQVESDIILPEKFIEYNIIKLPLNIDHEKNTFIFYKSNLKDTVTLSFQRNLKYFKGRCDYQVTISDLKVNYSSFDSSSITEYDYYDYYYPYISKIRFFR